MKRAGFFILTILLLCTVDLNLAKGQSKAPQSEVETALDSETSRAKTREALVKPGSDPLPALIAIAKSSDQTFVRRSRAIGLLATMKAPSSTEGLGKLTDDSLPVIRCLAMQSLAEINSKSAIAILIGKLDDQSVCRSEGATDPVVAREVFVSDEAIRFLEQMTGRFFPGVSANGHKATKPWKEWWVEQKEQQSN